MPMPTNPTKVPTADLPTRLANVRLLALDVDGVLTDGGVSFDEAGHETKRFHIHDGLGIVLANLAGLAVAWITGRTSPMVARRAAELGVTRLYQGVRDKVAVLSALAESLDLPAEAVAYMGDDLNDLPALLWAGVAFVPANAASPEVCAAADWIAPRTGGDGAVRDAIELLLRARGDDFWQFTLNTYLALLSTPAAQNPTQ